MNKLVNTGGQLKKAIMNYLRGIAEKDANTHRIQQLTQTSTIDKLLAVNIYRIISRDHNNKLQNVIRLLDKKLSEYQEYQVEHQTSAERIENFSLSLNVYRLKTLIKYNMPYEETVQSLLENILIDQIKESDFLTVLILLEFQPTSYSKSYNKLISNILDLLQEYLSKTEASPSFISSVAKSISKTPFKISKTLTNLINDSIDRSLSYYDFLQILNLSHSMRQKSLLQWIQIGNYDTSLIRKRIIYQYILNKQFNGLQFRSHLPGRSWNNASDLQEAIKCIRSMGVKESYIDIFPVVETHYTHPLQGFAQLEKVEFSNEYLDNIFSYMKNGYRVIDIYSYFRIIRTLKSFFMTDANETPSRVVFQEFYKKYNINLLNLATIVYELGRYDIEQREELHKLTQSFLEIIHTFITPQYLKSLPYEQYKNAELSFLYSYIYCETIDYWISILNQNSNSQSIERFKKIEVFLNNQKEKKFIVNDFSKINAFYKYVKAISEKDIQFRGESDILRQQKVEIDEIKEIVSTYCESNESNTFTLEKEIENFSKDYKIAKNVLFQPNVQVKYAIINKKTSEVITVFEYNQLILDRLAYEATEEVMQKNVVITREGKDLTLLGWWKRKFFNSFYKCNYFYCRSQHELLYKLTTAIVELSKS